MTKPFALKSACVAALLLVCLPEFASAEEASGKILPDAENLLQTIAGDWTFQTARYRGGMCQMDGTLTIFTSSRSDSDAVSCEILAIEVCYGLRSKVAQTCSVSRQESAVRIDSTIVTILESKGYSSGYAPDDFSLGTVTPEEMRGYLDSAAVAPVIFRRSSGGIS